MQKIVLFQNQTFELRESVAKQKKTCPGGQVLKLWLGQLDSLVRRINATRLWGNRDDFNARCF